MLPGHPRWGLSITWVSVPGGPDADKVEKIEAVKIAHGGL